MKETVKGFNLNQYILEIISQVLEVQLSHGRLQRVEILGKNVAKLVWDVIRVTCLTRTIQ